jgi:muramoyltetrapeptide carboxypeptidase
MSFNRKQFLHTLGGMGLASMFPAFTFNVSPGSTSRIIKPNTLRRGARIGLVSPAGILHDTMEYDLIIDTLKELDFKVEEGPSARQRYGYLAGKDEERAADLNAMFQNPEIDAILAYRGGWGSNRILPMIDYEAIRRNPKPFIGFSDITSLLMAIHAKTGLVTFHGPVGHSDWTDFTVNHFEKALMQPQPFCVDNPEPAEDEPTPIEDRIQTICGGRAKGRLLGGNLTVLTSMLGSDYLPEWKGAVLFLEDVGENIYRIDRMLTQLKLNGILEKLNGFVFGKCTECSPGSGYSSLTLEQVLDDHIKPLGVPAYRGAMIGHIPDVFTLPVGLPVTMDADKGKLCFEESAVTGQEGG